LHESNLFITFDPYLNETIMTPLQLQKYSDAKKSFKKDVMLFKNRKNYGSELKRVEVLKKEVASFQIMSLSKDVDCFLFNLA